MLSGRLPDIGLPPEETWQVLLDAAGDDVDWRAGRGWSLVYDRPPAVRDIVPRAAAHFAEENALSHGAFPSAARFEGAAVRMVASVVSPGAPVHGIFTSGGTESILLALKAQRDAHATERRRVVLIPRSAHPAYGKAAHLLGLPLRLLEVGSSGAVDADAVRAALADDVLVVGLSAPGFPTGALDPVADVAAQVAERGIGLHVDAALGGMVLPFLPGAPSFGVDVPGVSSVSVDLHKYGYAAKGAGVTLFADAALRRAGYFAYEDWSGGPYATGSVLGTRSVGPAAAACAALVTLGRSGYEEAVRQVMATSTRLRDGLAALGLYVLGDPVMSVFAVTGDEAHVSRVARGLSDRGWSMDVQLDPLSLHFVVFPRHAAVLDQFLTDAAAAAHEPSVSEGGLLSSYGVVVRDGRTDLLELLDTRYDGRA